MQWLNVFESLEKLNLVIKKLPVSYNIVYTYGAWDLLHPGHIRYFTRARELGDFLIVGVVADAPIRNLKGVDRPVQLQNERLVTVGSIRCIDAVIAQSEYDPSNELKALSRVDILTKGDDWEYIPGTETIKELGGEIIKLSYTDGFSTSSLVSKLQMDKE